MKPSKTAVAIPTSLLLLAAVVTLRNPDANGAPTRAAAAELVVSSARDAGPQTLRDAILAADRLSGRAHILVTAKLIAQGWRRSEEHTSELQSHHDLVCRLLLEKKKKYDNYIWRLLLTV